MRRKVLVAQNAGTLGRLVMGLLCIAVAAAVAGLWAAGCGLVAGSGVLVAEHPRVSAFTHVEVDGAFRVRVVRDSVYGVRVTVDENIAQYVQISVEDDTLHLGLEDGRHYVNAVLKAEVTLAKMSELDLDGGCRVQLQGFNALAPLEVRLRGHSRLQAIDLRSTALRLDLRQASIVDGTWVITGGRFAAGGTSAIRLSGAADRLRLALSGASSARLSHFRTESLDARLSGGSNAVVHVTGDMDADASDASTLEYVGTPKLGSVFTSEDSTVCSAED